jgi:hypothetical protein
MRIFVQNQGMLRVLPQADIYSSEDKIFGIRQSLAEKSIWQQALLLEHPCYWSLHEHRRLSRPYRPQPGSTPGTHFHGPRYGGGFTALF